MAHLVQAILADWRGNDLAVNKGNGEAVKQRYRMPSGKNDWDCVTVTRPRQSGSLSIPCFE